MAGGSKGLISPTGMYSSKKKAEQEKESRV